MSQRQGRDGESTRLSDDTAQRLLARATQLDSARTAGMSIAELRRAATEAGIAPEAFDQALIELHEPEPEIARSRPAQQSVRRIVTIVIMVLVTLLAFGFALRVVP